MAGKLSRRDFIKLTAGSTAALGVALWKFPEFEPLMASALKEVPVLWMQCSGDDGCAVSALNTFPTTIEDLVLSEVVSGTHISLQYQQNVMASQGDMAIQVLNNVSTGPYALVVEGAVPTNENGIFCTVGENNGTPIPVQQWVSQLGKNAIATIALGTCASFGGISSTDPNPSGAISVREFFKQQGITTPLINVPGCPPHPDWFVGTLASVLIGGPTSVEVDDQLRPTAFYSTLIHDQCPLRGQFAAGQFAKKLGDPGCMYELGCKGPVTHADCNYRLWNNKTNWCIEANVPCMGCAEVDFPGKLGNCYTPIKLPDSVLGVPGNVVKGAAVLAAVGVVGAVVKSAFDHKNHSDAES